MGYQALLFCPDDKTSRSVTQVLSELDFDVVPCTEPFAAVKKMMAERFDAVVVDCDNEQNATLLFKSARNTASNQSSLAVAVVEGQAGVAKAFRIGANLVLTKPINVEQAKGTLRVARGLLRKNEAAKSTMSAGSAPKPTPATAGSKPAFQAATPVRDMKPGSPTIVPVAAARSTATPAAKARNIFPANDTKFVAAEAEEPEVELLEVDEEPVVASTTARKTPVTPVSEVSPGRAKPIVATGRGRAGSAPSPASAASAPAPARESKSAKPGDRTSSTVETNKATVEIEGGSETSAITSASPPFPAPTFTFGGAIESGAQAGKSGTKKMILAVAAVALIAAGAYVAWMQFAPHGSNTAHPIASQPVKIPAPAPAAAAAPAAAPETAAAPAVTNPVPSPEPLTADTSTISTTEETEPSPAPQPATGSARTAHNSKPSAGSENAKPSAAAPAESKTTKAEAQAIVIKSGTANPAPKPAIPDAAAPSLDGVAVGSAVPMSNLMVGDGSAPAPVLQTVNISQGVSQGLVIKRVNPVYPANALRMRVEGTVQLLATVSGKGDVTGIKVLSGDKSLALAATDAVKQWKYKPYLLNGSPVEIETEITVKFKLPE